MRLRFHEYWWVLVIAIAGPLALALGGCSGRTSLPTAPFSRDLNAIAQDEPEPKPRPGSGRKPVVPCPTVARFDRSAFHTPTVIDNPYSPLIPGTQYVLSGQANRGGGLLPHTVVFTVTDVTKQIDGIRTLALWDRDFNEGVLAEEELAFFAQDDYGNIWGLGEYPEEFDLLSGEFLGAPNTWIVGFDRATAGTLMLGDLRRGKSYYSQGYAPTIEFLDCAQVLRTLDKITVPVGSYGEVLVIDEYGPFDLLGGHQRKYYARGVGNIQIGAINDPEGETLVMSSRRQLTPAELAAARQEVLRLDARGHMFNDIYAQTAPAQ